MSNRTNVVPLLKRAWSRVNQALLQLDHGPQEYMSDRVAALEARVANLERSVGADVGAHGINRAAGRK